MLIHSAGLFFWCFFLFSGPSLFFLSRFVPFFSSSFSSKDRPSFFPSRTVPVFSSKDRPRFSIILRFQLLTFLTFYVNICFVVRINTFYIKGGLYGYLFYESKSVIGYISGTDFSSSKWAILVSWGSRW